MMTLHLPVLGSRKDRKGFGLSGRRLGVGISSNCKSYDYKVLIPKNIGCDELGQYGVMVVTLYQASIICFVSRHCNLWYGCSSKDELFINLS